MGRRGVDLFWVDRHENVCGVVMSQYLGSQIPLADDIRQAVYQALEAAAGGLAQNDAGGAAMADQATGGVGDPALGGTCAAAAMDHPPSVRTSPVSGSCRAPN